MDILTDEHHTRTVRGYGYPKKRTPHANIEYKWVNVILYLLSVRVFTSSTHFLEFMYGVTLFIYLVFVFVSPIAMIFSTTKKNDYIISVPCDHSANL